MDFPYHPQETMYTCGAASSRMILDYFGKKISEKELSNMLNISIKKGVNLKQINKLFKKFNFQTKYFKDLKGLKKYKQLYECIKNGFIVIALVNRYIYDKKTPRIEYKTEWESKKYSYHFIVIYDIKKENIYFNDPHKEIGKSVLTKDKFLKASKGDLLAVIFT